MPSSPQRHFYPFSIHLFVGAVSKNKVLKCCAEHPNTFRFTCITAKQSNLGALSTLKWELRRAVHKGNGSCRKRKRAPRRQWEGETASWMSRKVRKINKICNCVVGKSNADYNTLLLLFSGAITGRDTVTEQHFHLDTTPAWLMSPAPPLLGSTATFIGSRDALPTTLFPVIGCRRTQLGDWWRDIWKAFLSLFLSLSSFFFFVKHASGEALPRTAWPTKLSLEPLQRQKTHLQNSGPH